MSTDMYGVRVLAVDPEARRLRVRVFVVYYDVSGEYHQPIPSDRSVFMRMLCDDGAFGDDLAEADQFDETYVHRNAFRFIERFEEVARRNAPVTDYSTFHDFYYESEGTWTNEESLVQADFDVFVTESAYLNAYTVGQSWGTTAYETDSDDLTLADYDAIPDWSDDRRFAPSLQGDDDDLNLSFSPDGRRLIVASNINLKVFETDGFACVLDVGARRDWGFMAGWSAAGQAVTCVDGTCVAHDLADHAATPLTNFGSAADTHGTHFIRWPCDQRLQIVNQEGAVVFERAGVGDRLVDAGFDAACTVCVLAEEAEPLCVIDLKTGQATQLPVVGLRAVAASPCGQFFAGITFDTVQIHRISGEVIRAWTMPRSGYVSGVAWSADGAQLAVAHMSNGSQPAEVSLHGVGRVVRAQQRAGRPLPIVAQQTIADIAHLYVARTQMFETGWSGHIDDDLFDFHLSMARMGVTCDLVPKMHSAVSKIGARAYETAILQAVGQTDGAQAAYTDALALLAAHSPEPWSHAFVYSALAGAHHAMGDADAAAAALQTARNAMGEESNDFQKRTVVARAHLNLGQLDAVRALIDEAEPDGWVSDFHVRLLIDLIDARAIDLLRHAWTTWSVQDEWDAKEPVLERLSVTDQLHLAAELDLDEDDLDDDEDAPEDEDAGVVAAQVRSTGKGTEAQLETAVAWFARRGCWADTYAIINAARVSWRSGLYAELITPAIKQGAVHIATDALSQQACGDMNALGLRALRSAFCRMAGRHYRVMTF